MTHLKEGQMAPTFEAKDQSGNTIKLDDYKGQKVILYFYPKDDTPGCTKEACNFRDNYQKLLDEGYQVLGVNFDDQDTHKQFAEKYDLPFPLVADPETKIVNDYGVYGLRNIMGKEMMAVDRKTFIIDEEGKIEKIIDEVKSQEATEQVLEVMGG